MADERIKIQVYLPTSAVPGWQRLLAEQGGQSASATATKIIVDAIEKNESTKDEIAAIKDQVKQTHNLLLLLIYMMRQQGGGPLSVPEDVKERLKELLL